MGKKKYYCDYCEKSFNDDLNTRTKHLSSFRHIQLKEEHYKNFKDPALILEEESVKKPCSRFQNDGICRFGISCRYSHYKPEEIDYLKQLVHSNTCEKVLPHFSGWFQQQMKNKDTSEVHLSYSATSPLSSLPPSLQPFDVMEYLTRNMVFWGD